MWLVPAGASRILGVLGLALAVACSRTGMPDLEAGPQEPGTPTICGDPASCTRGRDCCSGSCDAGRCAPRLAACSPDGAPCSLECCAGSCDRYGRCGRDRDDVTSCDVGGAACGSDAACCSGRCEDGSCSYAACYPGDSPEVLARIPGGSRVGRLWMAETELFVNGHQVLSKYGGPVRGRKASPDLFFVKDTDVYTAWECLARTPFDRTKEAELIACPRAGSFEPYDGSTHGPIPLAHDGIFAYWAYEGPRGELFRAPLAGGVAEVIATDVRNVRRHGHQIGFMTRDRIVGVMEGDGSAHRLVRFGDGFGIDIGDISSFALEGKDVLWIAEVGTGLGTSNWRVYRTPQSGGSTEIVATLQDDFDVAFLTTDPVVSERWLYLAGSIGGGRPAVARVSLDESSPRVEMGLGDGTFLGYAYDIHADHDCIYMSLDPESVPRTEAEIWILKVPVGSLNAVPDGH